MVELTTGRFVPKFRLTFSIHAQKFQLTQKECEYSITATAKLPFSVLGNKWNLPCFKN